MTGVQTCALPIFCYKEITKIEKQWLFRFMKILAESDSIGELWSYCPKYTYKRFGQELSGEYGTSDNYFFMEGKQMIGLIRDLLNSRKQ